jgi:Cu(I)/Ag(I) efflux system membrane fusion protein
MPWIRYGQDVSFTTPEVPGRKFKGKVLFLDPVLDMKTRTVKIRVEAENPEYILRPGMFVTAELEAEIDAKGRVIKPEWAGKYICPIHPSDHPSSEPGFCPESKMALRPASAFGYGDDPNPEFPLVIPAAAPLITGKRTIVYVEVPSRTVQPTNCGRWFWVLEPERNMWFTMASKKAIAWLREAISRSTARCK